MRKIHATREILLTLRPLDDALLIHFRRLTGRKDRSVLREGLQALARTSSAFDAEVFESFVREEYAKSLSPAARKKLDEQLEMFLGARELPDADEPFDSKADFG